MLSGKFGDIYNGKKVFITGNTGFKGTWITLWLEMLGAEVIGYSHRPITTPNHYNLLSQNIKQYINDVRDETSLKKAIEDTRPDLVIHMAAQPFVKLSYKEPVETFSTNVMGTCNVLDICKDVKTLKGVIVVTSDKCYDNIGIEKAYKEDDRMGGADPYSASKGCAELIVSSFRKSFFNSNDKPQLASVRAGNVIGGGDWGLDRLIPDIVNSTETTIIRSPDATRPWQHVLDCLSGYLLVGQKIFDSKGYGRGWNFGPSYDKAITVKEIAEKMKNVWNKIDFKIDECQQKVPEAKFLGLDSTLAKKDLLWEPIWDIQKSIEKTVEWYRNFHETKSIITHKQIEEYCSLAEEKECVWAK